MSDQQSYFPLGYLLFRGLAVSVCRLKIADLSLTYYKPSTYTIIYIRYRINISLKKINSQFFYLFFFFLVWLGRGIHVFDLVPSGLRFWQQGIVNMKKLWRIWVVKICQSSFRPCCVRSAILYHTAPLTEQRCICFRYYPANHCSTLATIISQ